MHIELFTLILTAAINVHLLFIYYFMLSADLNPVRIGSEFSHFWIKIIFLLDSNPVFIGFDWSPYFFDPNLFLMRSVYCTLTVYSHIGSGFRFYAKNTISEANLARMKRRNLFKMQPGIVRGRLTKIYLRICFCGKTRKIAWRNVSTCCDLEWR